MAEEIEVVDKPVKKDWKGLVSKEKPAAEKPKEEKPVVDDKPKPGDKTKPKEEKEEEVEKSIADFEEDDAPEVDKDGKPKEKEKEKPTPEAKLNLKRFTEVDPDIDSEDKLFERLKELHDENPKLKILAKGKSAIEEDKQIQGWKGWLTKNDEELYVGHLTGQYQDAGYTQEQALEKAQAKLEKAKEDNPDLIENTALQVRGGLNKAIGDRGNHIISEIQKAQEGVKKESKEDTTKFSESLVAKLNEKETFLGLKIASTPEARKKVFGKAEQLISNGDLSKLLKDPDFLADALYLHTNKKQLEKAISERNGNTRASMLDKMDKAPAVNPPKGVQRPAGTSKGFNAKNFK